MKTKTKLLTAGGTLLLALLLGTCNNYYHELIPSDDNDILSFALDGQIGSSKITRDAVYVTMKFNPESSYKMVPRISVPPKASIIPLTYEYLIAAFPHLKELPEEELLDEISKFTNAPDPVSYITGLMERSPGFNIPSINMPIDFSGPVDFFVIGGQGGAKVYTSKLLFDYYMGAGEVAQVLKKDPGTFTMGNDFYTQNLYFDYNAGLHSSTFNNDDDDDGTYWWLGVDAPAHQVKLTKSFYIGEDHITNAQFAAVMGYIPAISSYPNIFSSAPNVAAHITWDEAVDYCNELSVMEGFQPCYSRIGTEVVWNRSSDGYRLPTEAEFHYSFVPKEYAAFKPEGAVLGRHYLPSYYYSEAADFLTPLLQKMFPVSNLSSNETRIEYYTLCWDWYAPYDGFYESLRTREIHSYPQTDPSGPSESASIAFYDLRGLTGSRRLIATIYPGGYQRTGHNLPSPLIIARNAD